MKHRTCRIITLTPFLACSVSLPALAQVSIGPATIPADACLPEHIGVEIITGDQRVVFDPWFGGAPRYWFLYSQQGGSEASILSPHPGESMNPVYETGQDSTQTSANGVDPNPIARLDGSNSEFSYYSRETVLSQIEGQAVYEVVGAMPFFWLSHEAIDDAIPPRPDGCPSTAWSTPHVLKCKEDPPNPNCNDPFYCNCKEPSKCICEVSSNCKGRDLTACGTPLWFDARPDETTGIILVGNEKKPLERYTWNQRLCEIPKGRLACKIRISLFWAAADAVAAVMFRREVDTGKSDATIDDAFKSPGYFLFVNKNGVVQIARSDGTGNPPVVWNEQKVIYAPQISTELGVELELRTPQENADAVEIYVDGVKVVTYLDLDPVLGPHFGLYATASGGSIRFSHRQIFDMGLELVARYTGTADGLIESDLTVRNAVGVNDPRIFYPHHLPGPFMNAVGYEAASLDQVIALDACGRPTLEFLFDRSCGRSCLEWPGSCPMNPLDPGEEECDEGVLISSVLNDAATTYAYWLGDTSRTYGIYMMPVLAELDGIPAPTPWASAQYCKTNCFNGAVPELMVAQLSPFEYRNASSLDFPEECADQTAVSHRTVAWWAPRLVAPPGSNDSDGDGYPDDCPWNLFDLFVDSASTGDCRSGSVDWPYASVAEASQNAFDGDRLHIEAGEYNESITLSKSLRLESRNGLVRIGKVD